MKIRIHWIVVLLLVSLGTSASAQVRNMIKLEMRFPHLKLGENERVVSIELDMTASETTSISSVPAGWYVAVDNDPSWQAKIKANARVGAAALASVDLEKVRVVIAKHEFENLKFGISATLSVTADYKTERTIRLSSKDLMLAAVH